GSTSTELKSPQRPHCRLIFIGSLVTCASALMPCALSSALVMGGCRGLGLNGAMVPLVLCGQYTLIQTRSRRAGGRGQGHRASDPWWASPSICANLFRSDRDEFCRNTSDQRCSPGLCFAIATRSDTVLAGND